jgi:hypothetical protein
MRDELNRGIPSWAQQDTRRTQLLNFASHVQPAVAASSSSAVLRAMIRSSFTTTVLWQGNQFRTVKTFGARSCQLCTREKVAIVLETQRKSACVIISRLDLDGACPHHLKFHRFSFCASTDEDFYPEKESSTSLVPSLSDSCASESESMDDFQGLACVV